MLWPFQALNFSLQVDPGSGEPDLVPLVWQSRNFEVFPPSWLRPTLSPPHKGEEQQGPASLLQPAPLLFSQLSSAQTRLFPF